MVLFFLLAVAGVTPLAVAGVTLLAVAGVTLLSVRQMITVHVFVGVLPLGPVLLKSGTTMPCGRGRCGHGAAADRRALDQQPAEHFSSPAGTRP